MSGTVLGEITVTGAEAHSSLGSPVGQGILSESPEVADAAAPAPMAEQNSRRCGTWVGASQSTLREGSDSYLSAPPPGQAPHLLVHCLSDCAPGSVLPLSSGVLTCGPVLAGIDSFPPPPQGWAAGDRRAQPRTGSGAQSLAHPATASGLHRGSHAPLCVSPPQRLAQPQTHMHSATVRVSGRQVSSRAPGFVGVQRCPTFLPRVRLGLPLPLPLPPLSVLVPAASAPPSGLRHSA